jgi:hypothetical protein
MHATCVVPTEAREGVGSPSTGAMSESGSSERAMYTLYCWILSANPDSLTFQPQLQHWDCSGRACLVHVRCWFNSQLYKQYFTALVLTFHITGGRLFFFSISHEFYLFFKIYTTLYYYSLRDGSAIKSIGHSSREFRFSSHQPYGSSHLFLIPVPGD